MTPTTTLPEDRWAATSPGRAGVDRSGGTRRFVRRFLRGRPDDPVWVRPALLALLASTAVLYIWGLGASGWANSFYTAAVQAGTKSWKAFFFGSFDSSNFITVDKSPGALWVMELSARVFGFNSWSVLVPQALEGVATAGLVYLAVRRWFTPAAGLVAGLVAASTPVATLMFRFNNPDALMVMLLALAAYATVRLVDDGRARWAVVAGTSVGFAFLAKMLEAFLVVPALALVILVAGYGPLSTRIRQLLFLGAAIAVSAGWWVAAVQLTPAADRPYVGGSQNNSLWNLMFGYNGFGRLSGNESGSVGGSPAGAAGRWGTTGLTRLFGSEMGTQISWLLPAALLLLVAGLLITRGAGRTNRTRAGLLIWGGWLVFTGLAISLGKGIIHPYYTVALAPAVGALIGAGGSLMWANRERWTARALLAASMAGTGVWAAVLLDRTPSWNPWLRPVVLVCALAAGAGVLAWPYLSAGLKAFRSATAVLALAGGLAAPLAYSFQTAATAQSGAIPAAGPAGASTGAGPGGFRRGGGGLGRTGLGGPGFAGGQPQGGQAQGGLPPGSGFAGGQFPGGQFPGGQFPGGQGGRFAGGGFPVGQVPGGAKGGATGGGGPLRAGGAPSGGGGLLNASRPSSAMVALLEDNASRYQWVAAAVGANEAAGYQISTGDPVMAIGGFNGTDPYPTLAQFQKLVRQGKVHYFVAGRGGAGLGAAGFGGAGSGSAASSAITAWVEANYTSSTVGGVTVYDLTPSGGH